MGDMLVDYGATLRSAEALCPTDTYRFGAAAKRFSAEQLPVGALDNATGELQQKPRNVDAPINSHREIEGDVSPPDRGIRRSDMPARRARADRLKMM